MITPAQSQTCTRAALVVRRVLVACHDSRSFGSAIEIASRLTSASEILLLKPAKAGEAVAAYQPSPTTTTICELRVHASNAAEILCLVAERHIDLVVLGMESPIGPSRLMGGCAAEEVFRGVPCPCVVLGPKLKPLRGGPVVFATNFQEPTMATINLAAELAANLGVRLQCAYVLPKDVEAKGRVARIIPEIMRHALMEGARKHAIRIDAEDCHILYGNSVSASLAVFVEEQRASLLVLAVSKRSRLVSHPPAGITANLIAIAPCCIATHTVADPFAFSAWPPASHCIH